ncbi:glycosyltransferase family A protein [Sphingobacterium sp. G1-14]|uniref:glycosyltransferase family A protein n=1 Tax=Sphingobacterium sp. G1-14 TaxID=2003121 RepID=UPI000B48C78F|nr:glycosyltransferase family A protein [Sphingobacterium sp. G1-14]
MKKHLKRLSHFLLYKYLIFFNTEVKKQRKNSKSIPILIINYNQLENLKYLVSFLLKRGFKNIIIIDNKSTYAPLLEYYNEIRGTVTVEMMSDNLGHMVFFENKQLQEKYGQGYYCITDADIRPNDNLPDNFLDTLIRTLDRYQFSVLKTGFALDLESIPEYYPFREKVIKWEQQFWEHQLDTNIYKAGIDTTFALYKPKYPINFKVKPIRFYEGIRIAGDFTSKHMGWYLNPKNLTEEQLFYMRTSSSSSSWKFDEDGNLAATETNY